MNGCQGPTGTTYKCTSHISLGFFIYFKNLLRFSWSFLREIIEKWTPSSCLSVRPSVRQSFGWSDCERVYILPLAILCNFFVVFICRCVYVYLNTPLCVFTREPILLNFILLFCVAFIRCGRYILCISAPSVTTIYFNPRSGCLLIWLQR